LKTPKTKRGVSMPLETIGVAAIIVVVMIIVILIFRAGIFGAKEDLDAFRDCKNRNGDCKPECDEGDLAIKGFGCPESGKGDYCCIPTGEK